MNERRPTSIAQSGMTAWGRAAERELEAYRRRTAFASPVDLADRVMAAIEAESPARRYRWSLPMPVLAPGRIRIVGGMATVLVAMLGGVALVGGASALIGRDLGAPTVPPRDDRPIVVVEPTGTAREDADATTDPPGSARPPKRPEPRVRDAVEASVAPGVADTTDKPGTSDEVDGTDEPEATDDALDDDRDEPDESDVPDDDASAGNPEDGSEGDEPQEPTGS